MTKEISPDDRDFFDPVAQSGWIIGDGNVYTEGTPDEEARTEADRGREHFMPPQPDEVVYEGFIDEKGRVQYVRKDVADAETSADKPYAVVVPVPDAMFMQGEPLPRSLTDSGNDQHKNSRK